MDGAERRIGSAIYSHRRSSSDKVSPVKITGFSLCSRKIIARHDRDLFFVVLVSPLRLVPVASITV